MNKQRAQDGQKSGRKSLFPEGFPRLCAALLRLDGLFLFPVLLENFGCLFLRGRL